MDTTGPAIIQRRLKRKQEYWANPDKYRAAARYYHKNKKTKSHEWYRELYANTREQSLAACKRYRDKHKVARNARERERYRKNRAKKLAQNREWARRTKYKHIIERRKKDPLVQLKHRIGSRIRMAVRAQNTKKQTGTERLVGCRMDFFRQFLQAQFTPNMTWENHGTYWEIDHIIPVSSFDLTIPDNQRIAFHYSNCRPLLKPINTLKSDSMPGPHQALLL